MIRPPRAIMIIVLVAVGAPPSRSQTPSAASSSQAMLDEAEQLNELATRLYGEGKYSEAIVPAERALALLEKTRGPTHPDVATSLNNLAALYQAQGACAKAESLYTRALDILEKALGPTHPDVAQSMSNLATLYQAQGAYAKAEPLYTRALDIREKVFGPIHPDVATNLNNLATLYQAQGAYAKAEPLLARALDILEKTLGPTHPDVATGLNNLAELYRDQGAYAKAEPLLVRALDVREKALGPNHPDVAGSLNNLAELYTTQGAYGKAEPLYLRALDIKEKVLGPTHPDVATSLNNLAALYQDQGAYAKAESLYARALNILETELGPAHLRVAESLNNLAGLYHDQGAYSKAERFFARALGIREKALGPSHPVVAQSLNDLALLYRDQGAYGKAESLLLRALGISEKALGPMHRDVATSLSNLAALYRSGGAYSRAEPLLVRALDILEKTLGPSHPLVATSLNNLAELYQVQGAYSKAEPLFARVLDIYQRTLGPSHPLFATSLNNFGVLYRRQGAHRKAELLYERALDIREKTLGATHPDVATSLNNLAELYEDQGAYDKAEPLLVRAAHIREQQLRNELGWLSETRKRGMMTLLQGETDSLISFHMGTVSSNAHALELAFTTVLQRKGRILDSLVDSQAALRAHLTPGLRRRFDQLSQARSELAARLYAPTGPLNEAAAQRDAITALRVHIDELEAALSAASEDFRIQAAPVTVATVQAALPADAALVEFVRYQRFDPRQAQQSWREERYVAYLLTQRDLPRWVALGEAAPIDAAVDAVLAKMDRRIPVAAAKAALQRLDALVFAPVRAQLPGISHVIVAPDGPLNLVPFEALVDAQGHYALECTLVSYVSSGRDLLRLARPPRPRASAVIVAGPDYGPLPSPSTAATLSFAPLAGAAAEATDLRGYFSTTVTGAQATKAALKALTGPAMLHIATHGFYGWPAGAAAAATRSAGPAASRGRLRSGIVGVDALPLPPIRDPAEGLDQSGLALAGANRGPDGLVTAREIAGFDWWGTQLVVLSACQTGVGAVPSGDGVYGLRRALVLAGAASQVVSLWKVSDEGTRALMRDYYGQLKRGAGRAEALRQAQLRMQGQSSTAHPFYWAAFIPAGDWRPLDPSAFSPPRATP